GYLSPRYFTSEKEWRSREFIQLSPESVRQVKTEITDHPEESFLFNSNGQHFTVQGTGGLNTEKEVKSHVAKNFLIGFKNIEFEAMYAGNKTDCILASKPLMTMTIQAEGKTIPEVKIYSMLA